MAVRLAKKISKTKRIAPKKGKSSMLDLSTVTSMQEGMKLLGEHMAQRRKEGLLTQRKGKGKGKGKVRRTRRKAQRKGRE